MHRRENSSPGLFCLLRRGGSITLRSPSAASPEQLFCLTLTTSIWPGLIRWKTKNFTHLDSLAHPYVARQATIPDWLARKMQCTKCPSYVFIQAFIRYKANIALSGSITGSRIRGRAHLRPRACVRGFSLRAACLVALTALAHTAGAPALQASLLPVPVAPAESGTAALSNRGIAETLPHPKNSSCQAEQTNVHAGFAQEVPPCFAYFTRARC
jgi:hypothetical protein